MKNKLSDDQKLELVNCMKVIDSSSFSEELEYVHVEKNTLNKNILRIIGCSQKEIDENSIKLDPLEDIIYVIDISILMFDKIKSIKWFDGEKFLDYIPKNSLTYKETE